MHPIRVGKVQPSVEDAKRAKVAFCSSFLVVWPRLLWKVRGLGEGVSLFLGRWDGDIKRADDLGWEIDCSRTTLETAN